MEIPEYRTERVQNPDGSVSEFRVKILARRDGAIGAMAQPAPVPVIETAHVAVRPVAEAAPVAQDAHSGN